MAESCVWLSVLRCPPVHIHLHRQYRVVSLLVASRCVTGFPFSNALMVSHCTRQDKLCLQHVTTTTYRLCLICLPQGILSTCAGLFMAKKAKRKSCLLKEHFQSPFCQQSWLLHMLEAWQVRCTCQAPMNQGALMYPLACFHTAELGQAESGLAPVSEQHLV